MLSFQSEYSLLLFFIYIYTHNTDINFILQVIFLKQTELSLNLLSRNIYIDVQHFVTQLSNEVYVIYTAE